MTENNQPAELVPRVEYTAYPAAPAADAAPQAPLAKAHRILRGRYPWAFGLAVVLGTAGGIAGAVLPKPVYRSTGIIDVAPKVKSVLFESEDKGVMPMFDNFVQTQATIASSRRVTEMAMRSPEWQAMGRGFSEKALAIFQENLSVTHPRATQYVQVSVADESPECAAVAVNQIMKAYLKVYTELEQEAGLEQARAIEKQRDLDQGKATNLRKDIFAATDDMGVEALDARYQSQIDQWNKLTGSLDDLDVEIATIKAASDLGPVAANHVFTDEEIAARGDKEMARLIEVRGAAKEKLSALLAEGYGQNNPKVVEVRETIEGFDKKIKSQSDTFLEALSKSPDMRSLDLVEKHNQRTKLVAMRDAAEDVTKKLGKRRNDVAQLRADLAEVEQRISIARKKLETMSVESEIHGRVSPLVWGERPFLPDTDRRNQLAFAGVMAGAALGFGIVLLVGLRSARLRHIVDVDGQASGGRFLGIVPDISDAAIAARPPGTIDMGDYCVHHIRTMLQLRASGKHAVLALTSPTPGSGKTTLAVALGMSFAAAGQRTLLVDCDFIGHGLSSAIRSL